MGTYIYLVHDTLHEMRLKQLKIFEIHPVPIHMFGLPRDCVVTMDLEILQIYYLLYGVKIDVNSMP